MAADRNMVKRACERVNVSVEQSPEDHREALENALHLALDALGLDWPTGYGTCVHGNCDADAATVDSHGDPLCARHDNYRNGSDR